MNALIIAFCLLNFGIGGKIDLAGGPIPSLVLTTQFNSAFSANLTAGGFPTNVGPIVRTALNMRYSFKDGKKWQPYLQGGLSFTGIYFNEESEADKGRSCIEIKAIHFNFGYTWNCSKRFAVSLDLGALYGPKFINPVIEDMIEEEGDDIVPIVPILGLEVIYRF
ncbi:hypothetical protein KAJ26_00395 [bacterium]|nr:hypothetical protein [bacterium]